MKSFVEDGVLLVRLFHRRHLDAVLLRETKFCSR